MERSRARLNWENPPFSETPPETGTATDLAAGPESINALARRVLFATDLDEKLRLARRPLAAEPTEPAGEPGTGSFERVLPGRPSHLRFASDSAARPTLPTRPGLVNEENRGVLLHFFANHELLAAELMALALLKFPDAPAAFREGLANTLREEQLHTRWYVNRMRECGVEFGQYPLSRFFWEAVSCMESPLDYVSRLSLTFEQANLDYALHYGHLLREAGDGKSASILLRIYEDEIAHVGYGLSWFRRWKEEKESDWSALQKRLPFPLSPSRAKGNRTGFNEAGRCAAGFDEDYIQRLALFERSKGRTPNVFYFNPEAEHRAAVWPQPYHPDKKALAVIHGIKEESPGRVSRQLKSIRAALDNGTFDPEPYYEVPETKEKTYSVGDLYLNSKVQDLFVRAEVEREDYRKKTNPPNIFFGAERQFRFPRSSETPWISFTVKTLDLNLFAMVMFVVVAFFSLRASLKRQLQKI
jgi:uncharacterized ferritin-like protein (DUF455 family)